MQTAIQRAMRWLIAGTAFACFASCYGQARYVPIISGGVGALGGVNGGTSSMQTTIMPVAVVPLGTNLMVEARGNVEGLYTQTGRTGPYNGKTLTSLQVLQFNYLASSHLTIVGGRFLIPFGTYNERLSPIWVSNFQNAPTIAAIGNLSSGFANGGMLRGSLFSTPHVHIDGIGYFSAFNQGPKFKADRMAGFRFDMYFPGKRLEIGTSYSRFLQQYHTNSKGIHLWWQPYRAPLSFRSEYARGPNSSGYWFESAYRFSQFGGPDTLIGRFEPVFRMQQTFRNSPSIVGESDGLPAVGTQEADFGFDYHLPHETRLNTSYSRVFSSAGNHNIWQISLVYRLLFPAWKGHSK